MSDRPEGIMVRPSSFRPTTRDRLHFAAGYLLTVTALNLPWEFAQLPLYTIWTNAPFRDSLFAALHCTLGDLVIATTTLALVVFLAGRNWPYANYQRVAIITVILGVTYAVFSEWLNVEIRRTWAYGSMMPRLPWVGTGLSPLAQWMVIPSVAFALLRRRAFLTGNPN
jgi:hypothetical protein